MGFTDDLIEFYIQANAVSSNVNYPIYFSTICICLVFLGIVIYVIAIVASVFKKSKNMTDLNIETIEYASIYHLAFINKGRGSFNYSYFFVIFLGMAFFTLLYYRLYPDFKTLDNYGINTRVMTVVTIAIIAIGIAILLQILIMVYTGININTVKKQVDALDTHIRGSIYKKRDFLNKLRKQKTDINDSYNTIVGCVAMLKKESDVKDLAKGFYTLTLYNYYNHFTSINMKGAYAIFDVTVLADQKKSFKPSAYMPRYGTFIEDIGETIRKHIPPSNLVNEAMNMCDIWVSKTNELANTIYPDKAFNFFLLMIIATFLINVLVVSSVCYFGIYKPRTIQDIKHDDSME